VIPSSLFYKNANQMTCEGAIQAPSFFVLLFERFVFTVVLPHLLSVAASFHAAPLA
jgi:hypothetical protein